MEASSATNPDTDGERTLDEAALLARVMRYFDGAIRGLRKRDRMVVLRATDDFWTVMETLSLAPVAESAECRVRLRGALAKRKLLQMDGGVLSPSSAAALLGVSRQAVGQRRAAGRLLGVEGTRGYLYPAWQFTDRGMLPGFEDSLRALRGEDAWSILTFFLESDATNGNARPLDLLRTGRLDAVARAAELYGEQAAV